jgi:septum formation protein
MAHSPLILASSSVYRQRQLAQLGVGFIPQPPAVDEALLRDEPPRTRALRLAEAKARSLRQSHPQAWILGSDQVCSWAGTILRKPGSLTKQQQHLEQLSGQEVDFHTAVALSGPGGELASMEVLTQARLRPLTQAEITAYVANEPAADCAGGFKVEGLGIRLFDWIRSDDPSALVGLPLIACGQLIRKHLPQLWEGLGQQPR